MSGNYVVPEIEDEVTCWLLAQHPDASIRAYAVASPYADDSVIELLLGDENLMVVQAAIYHPRLPHTPEAAAAVRKNDALITKAITGLTPPDRDTTLWLYVHGGPSAKSASLRTIGQDRALTLRGLAEGVILDRDIRLVLNRGFLRPEDHATLSTHELRVVREWVIAATRDPALLQAMANDIDPKVADEAVSRLGRLGAQRTSIF